jgi:hypothetical protein
VVKNTLLLSMIKEKFILGAMGMMDSLGILRELISISLKSYLSANLFKVLLAEVAIQVSSLKVNFTSLEEVEMGS